MNDLEQWLADVKAYNDTCRELDLKVGGLQNTREHLVDCGAMVGFRTNKIKSMLARVKLKVEMPEEPKAGT